MAVVQTDIDLQASSETRPGGFGFFDIAYDLSVDRYPTGLEWVADLPLPVWSAAHLQPVTDYDRSDVTPETGGSRLDEGDEVLARRLAATDGADADSLPDCLGGTGFHMYVLRQESPTLDQKSLQESVRRRIGRVAELVFSRVLIQQMEGLDVDIPSTTGRQAGAPDAVAIADDALLNLGIHGGVIHVPAYLAARIKADLGPENITHNGNRIHLYPSAALAGGTPKVYATPPIGFARHDQVAVVDTINDGGAGAHFQGENLQVAEGRLYASVAFDGVATSIETDTLADITTAAV